MQISRDFSGKVEIVPVQTMKACRGSGVMAPLETGWR